jgi:lipopolysaccharide transport system ATP-binding protein
MPDAVTFDHVSKSFRYFQSPLQRLRDVLVPFGGGRHTDVHVLRDLTFSVPRRQTLAIVGPNGVGKSTLLHIVAGLVEPTSGTVSVNGRVTGLLDLGGSFLPELTGRENARFFHEIVVRDGTPFASREADIEAFAELGEFFDRPLRTYSSGMLLRLAFAAATCENPDVLLVDEMLAVGDARFQQKCYRRIRELRERGTTILLVTHVVHNLPAVCDRVIVLDNGGVVFDGDPAAGVKRYFQLFFSAPERPGGDGADGEVRYGEGAAITGVFATRDGVTPESTYETGEVVRIVFDVEFAAAVAAPVLGLACYTKEGHPLYAVNSTLLGEPPHPAVAGERRHVEFELRLDVIVQDVFIDLSVFEMRDGSTTMLDVRSGVLHLTIAPSHHCYGIVDLGASLREVR